jgi:hypothetical protein
MPKRKLRKPYKGVLKVPAPKYDHSASEEDNFDQWIDSVNPKINALFDHYGISRTDDNKWLHLALYLAIDHVPHFAPTRWPDVKRTDGAAKKREEDFYLSALLAAAEEDNESVKNTTRHITKPTSPYRLFRGKNPATLRERYYLLKDKQSLERKRLMTTIEWLKKASAKDLKTTEEGIRNLSVLLSFAEAKLKETSLAEVEAKLRQMGKL